MRFFFFFHFFVIKQISKTFIRECVRVEYDYIKRQSNTDGKKHEYNKTHLLWLMNAEGAKGWIVYKKSSP